mgnify:CR=1 FL=1
MTDAVPLLPPERAAQLAVEFGLKPDEYENVLAILGRLPRLAELGVFSVMWSEHCSYKSSRIWLKELPTKAPWVIQGPGENAGVIDIGEGLAAVFKMESHNHPSYIEPYNGAATGVGGILRDVFTMGARPIACLNALRFGAPDHPKTRHLVAGVVAGIGGKIASGKRVKPVDVRIETVGRQDLVASVTLAPVEPPTVQHLELRRAPAGGPKAASQSRMA